MKISQTVAYIKFFEIFLNTLLILIKIKHRNITWNIWTMTQAKTRGLLVANKTMKKSIKHFEFV